MLLTKCVFVGKLSEELFSVQMGWQDCITRLLIKTPITDACVEAFPDLMSFDEDDDPLDVEQGRTSPSSASRISGAAYAIESEIKGKMFISSITCNYASGLATSTYIQGNIHTQWLVAVHVVKKSNSFNRNSRKMSRSFQQ